MAKKETENKKETKAKKTTTRKKPGPKPGSPSNNPFGRPEGAKNKMPNRVKLLLEDWSVDEFEGFKKDYKAMKPKDRADLYEKITRRFVPRPMNDEEVEDNKEFAAEFMRRLFGGQKKEENQE